ncbi:MAG: pyruvate formate lyase family protein [Victivallales bacterium]
MSYQERIARLRKSKATQTKEKIARLGPQDEDDYGYVLPPDDFKWELPCSDGQGWFYGAKAWGTNFKSLLEYHPVYIDSDDALAGRWMFMLSRMRRNYKLSLAPFPFDYSHLHQEQKLYDITCGIGKDAHFAPDYGIGLELGWEGLKGKVKRSLKKHSGDTEAEELLNAELDAISGVQNWIKRTASSSASMARQEPDAERYDNLLRLADINRKLSVEPPATFHEACQWIAWFNMASRTYNRDGAGGQLDELLRPYYEKDLATGRIDREQAIFIIACLLLNDPHYYQLGGPDADGKDQTSELSFMILEAAHMLKSSCNLTIRVFEGMNENLFRRGLEILFADRLGYPRFSGDRALVAGFMKNGYDVATARRRIALGCNWMSLPGLEYTLNDVVKINIAKVFDVAMHEMFEHTEKSVTKLWKLFTKHLRRAVHCTAKGLDFHLKHQYLNEPELMLNLLSHGPIEKGRDVSHGGAEFYNMCIDGAGLAVVADSFAALEQCIEREHRFTWNTVTDAIIHNYKGTKRETVRLWLSRSERFGQGASLGDKWAQKLTAVFTKTIKSEEVPPGHVIIPGWFSWADSVRFGKSVGATPNGRYRGMPISHGANPLPGFRKDGALTAIIKAVAVIQPGYGNTAPLQLEIDTGSISNEHGVEVVGQLLKTHFELGGTLVNINIIDADKLRAAHHKPELYPDLIVRVTGFSAYFASLSPDFRELVVNRIIGAT